jgi:hypothetical protein
LLSRQSTSHGLLWAGADGSVQTAVKIACGAHSTPSAPAVARATGPHRPDPIRMEVQQCSSTDIRTECLPRASLLELSCLPPTAHRDKSRLQQAPHCPQRPASSYNTGLPPSSPLPPPPPAFKLTQRSAGRPQMASAMARATARRPPRRHHQSPLTQKADLQGCSGQLHAAEA